MNTTQLLRVEALGHGYGHGRARQEVIEAIDLSLAASDIFGLVGESGAGKTTLARCILGLQPPDRGRVLVHGEDAYATAGGYRDSRLRRRVQAVFQDPLAALNPRHDVRRALLEPLAWHAIGTAAQREERIRATLDELQLDPALMGRFPSQLSGGQRQRVCLGRAIVLEPDLVVLDEPVTALDVSVQALVLDLLRRLRERHGTAFLLISHDLAVVQQIADRVGVLHHGRLVETGTVNDVFGQPRHDYTRSLLAAVPRPEPARGGRQRFDAG